jgi:hypothetical protein
MWQGGYRGTCSSCAMRLKSVRLVTLRTETDDGLVWCLIRISLRVFYLGAVLWSYNTRIGLLNASYSMCSAVYSLCCTQHRYVYA